MRRRVPLLALALVLAGCEPEAAHRSYAVPKSAPATSPPPSDGKPMTASPAMVAQAGAFGSPRFPATPAGWTAKEPGAMRKGSWTVGAPGAEAELAVTVFPGDVGGRMANINRWRAQLGLEPAVAEQYDAIAIAKVGSAQGEVVDLRSADGARATAAVLVRQGDATWFFKLTGAAATVDAARATFLAFVAATELP